MIAKCEGGMDMEKLIREYCHCLVRYDWKKQVSRGSQKELASNSDVQPITLLQM